MKIVFITNPPLADLIDRERLNRLGEYSEFTEEELKQKGAAALLTDAEILLCGAQLVKKELMAVCPKLKLVVVRATGFNTVDLDYARERGITVCNNPLYGTIPVAQHTMALLFALTNRVPEYNARIRAGEWKECKAESLERYPLTELFGKTLGIIGFGRIGRSLAGMAAGFGMRILANDVFETEAGRNLAKYVSMDRLLEESDVISLHCPLTPENLHLIDRAAIARMKDGVFILNASRGKLIDENALTEALYSGKVRGAGLDVLEEEPPAADCPLLSAPNCIITPHIAWIAPESRRRMADMVIDTAEAWLKGQPVHVVS